ncbi:MAG: glucose-6-phosphate dehydrogenase [Peptostreptococcus sp.]|uniref:glucose-6-phosphate dehydrogenase n=1 Tax=Peptostreptococcus sp. TaxID=1262 RepID=UPI002FCBC242
MTNNNINNIEDNKSKNITDEIKEANQKIANNAMVIFGGTGDLAYRKLFPALYNLHCLNTLPEDYEIIGVGRRDYSQEEYIKIVQDWMKEFSRLKYTDEKFEEFKSKIRYYKMDMSDSNEYKGLIDFIDSEGIEDGLIYYYAVSPELFDPITEGLKKGNCQKHSCQCENTPLNESCCMGDTKVIIEKPFGENLQAAEKIYSNLKSYFKTENIYHIDHYLGKEMIINIMTLRFANALFKAVWNNEYIEKVEINAYETVGVDSRGGYYDKSGALADMIQNHLFQIMSIVAMEKPKDNNTISIKDSQNEVFKQLKDIDGEKIDEILLMGQYNGYRDEEKVDPNSVTETYVALKLEIENERWKGVPFYLRTGKKLDKRESEVIVSFKSMEEGVAGNNLLIKIQPDEGVKLNFNIKKPGIGNQVIKEVEMDFCQSCILENRANTPEAYERLLKSCMDSDKSLFSQWKQIETSWKYINKIVDSYKKYSNKLYFYDIATNGPVETF